MKVLLSYIRLVRPLNLLMILFTLYMVRLFFLLSQSQYPKLLNILISGYTYALFSSAFVFVAAAGYIINDYYDIETDRINKPGKAIIGTIISPRSILVAYWVLTSCGILTGFIACYNSGVPLLNFLFLFYWVGLWLYSYKLKSTFLLGNLLIGIFLALVPLGGACIELCSNIPHSKYEQKNFIWGLMAGISLFAFLSTVAREIVKDAEDVAGDTVAGYRTMPIVIGIRKTKWIVFSLLLVLNISLGYIQYQALLLGIYPLLYFLVFIQSIFLIIFYTLQKADTAKDFHKISTWLKIVMLTGMLYLFGIILYIHLISLFFSAPLI